MDNQHAGIFQRLNIAAAIWRALANALRTSILLIVWSAVRQGQPETATQKVVDAVQASQRQLEQVAGRMAGQALDDLGVPTQAQSISTLRPEQRASADTWAPIVAKVQAVVSDSAVPPTSLPPEVQQEIDQQIDQELAQAHEVGTTRTYETRKAKIDGYRRVIHPELSMGGSCGLCIVASTRVYHKPDLKPLHDHCHCTVLPIVGEQDPGGAINYSDLKNVYNMVDHSTSASKLKQLRLQPDGTLVRNPSRVPKLPAQEQQVV